jgi:hypothetical protein
MMIKFTSLLILGLMLVVGGCAADCKDCTNYVIENNTPIAMRYQIDGGFAHVTAYGETDDVPLSRSSPHVITIDYGQITEYREYRPLDGRYHDRGNRVGFDQTTVTDDLVIRPELHRVVHVSWDAQKNQWVAQENKKPNTGQVVPTIDVGPVGPPQPMGPVGPYHR